jgi:hypothetical protein
MTNFKFECALSSFQMDSAMGAKANNPMAAVSNKIVFFIVVA